jgi:ABC-type multidrug transport system fused ATPase/permease subunit
VLVDEATASIDYASDEVLQKVIKEQLSNSTMFTIAHRIETIMSSDRIMVLDKGKILELDTPTALLQRQESIFRNLYK